MAALPTILGHQRATAELWAALAQGSPHHAYLFEGPAGVGKRTVADRYAMAANCEGPSPHPCGECRPCRSIAAGTHPDVLVLEPATDRASRTIPVKDVREVIRKTGYHRYAGRRRIIVIDPADAMQPAAANALLKTLEEPPEGTGFLLLAAHGSALLPTIVSRCQRIRFGPVPRGEIRQWLVDRRTKADVAEQAAALSLGCPGRALELAGGALKKRLSTRDALLDALAGGREALEDHGRKLTAGDRQKWLPKVELVFEVIEDLLRDATVRAAGTSELLNSDRAEVVERWSRAMWPGGVERCSQAIQQSRDALQIYVTGRTVVDALFATLAEELGPAVRG